MLGKALHSFFEDRPGLRINLGRIREGDTRIAREGGEGTYQLSCSGR